jgi:hypothetical protein
MKRPIESALIIGDAGSNAHRAMLPPMNPEEDLIGTADATRILSVDKTTITRWVASGKLVPALKLPRRNGAYLFKRADVEALKDK